eukprot:3668798-Rhodomonas_salina.4
MGNRQEAGKGMEGWGGGDGRMKRLKAVFSTRMRKLACSTSTVCGYRAPCSSCNPPKHTHTLTTSSPRPMLLPTTTGSVSVRNGSFRSLRWSGVKVEGSENVFGEGGWEETCSAPRWSPGMSMVEVNCPLNLDIVTPLVDVHSVVISAMRCSRQSRVEGLGPGVVLEGQREAVKLMERLAERLEGNFH